MDKLTTSGVLSGKWFCLCCQCSLHKLLSALNQYWIWYNDDPMDELIPTHGHWETNNWSHWNRPYTNDICTGYGNKNLLCYPYDSNFFNAYLELDHHSTNWEHSWKKSIKHLSWGKAEGNYVVTENTKHLYNSSKVCPNFFLIFIQLLIQMTLKDGVILTGLSTLSRLWVFNSTYHRRGGGRFSFGQILWFC